MDRIVVPVPTREWALGAIEDLRREGLTANLEGRDACGRRLVNVEGPEGSIAEIRYALHGRGHAIDWDTFMNSGVEQDRPTERL